MSKDPLSNQITTVDSSGAAAGEQRIQGKRRGSSASTRDYPALSPDLRAAVENMIEDAVRRLYVDPHAEAFSIAQFCARYGVGRTTVYEQIAAGWLVARKPRGSRRTLIAKAEADRWLASAPAIKPGETVTEPS